MCFNKLFKKAIATVVSLFLFAPSFSGKLMSVNLNDSSEKTSSVCEPPKSVFGFELKQVYRYNKHPIFYYEHKKSGAKVIVEKTKRKKKYFEIAFRTPSKNSKGVNHVIEHSILNGSKKYPCKNILWQLINTAKSMTLINAFTHTMYTSYPLEGYSENELESMAKIYVDGVFDPMFLKDEKIFKKEGIRFELDDKGYMIPNGTVFNEMKTDVIYCYYKYLKRIFPNSSSKNFSGGSPHKILDLTYHEICDTYKKYYHPSNCLVYLGGDIDYERFLKWLDNDYFSRYETKDMSYVKYENQDISKVKSFETLKLYSPTVRSSEIVSDFFVPWEVYKENRKQILFWIDSFNKNNDLKQKINQLGYDSIFFSTTGEDTYDICLKLNLICNKENAKLSSPEGIKDVLKKISEEFKVTDEQLDDYLNRLKFSVMRKNVFGGNSEMVIWSREFVQSFIRFGDPVSSDYFSIDDDFNLHLAKKNFNASDVNNFMREIISHDPIITIFDFSDDEDKSLSKKIKDKVNELQKYKKFLTKGYKKQLEWAKSENSKREIKKILKTFNPCNDISFDDSLPNIELINIGDKKCYFAETKDDNYISFKVAFKLNHLSEEDRKYIMFFQLACDEMVNKKGNKFNFNYSMSVQKNSENSYDAFLIFNLFTDKKNKEYALQTLSDLFSKKEFLNKECLEVYLSNIIAVCENSNLNYRDFILSLGGNRTYKFFRPFSGKQEYEFVKEIRDNLNNEKYMEEFYIKLNNLKDSILNHNAIKGVGMICSTENEKSCIDVLSKFFDSFSSKKIDQTRAVNFDKMSYKSEAFINELSINNTVYLLIPIDNIEYIEKFSAVVETIKNKFLIPEIRERGGAYGCCTVVDENEKILILASIQDPNIDSTVNLFKKFPQFLNSNSLTEEELSKIYYSHFIQWSQKETIEKVESQIFNLICKGVDYIGLSEKKLEQIKNISPNDLNQFAKEIKEKISESKVVVVTNSLENVKTSFEKVS